MNQDQGISPEELEELKDYLEELIVESYTLKSMTEEEREAQIEKMRNAPPEKLKKIVQTLEEEREYVKEVEKEYQEHAEEVEQYKAELKHQEHKEDREARVIAESKEQVETQKEATNLMSKLEEAVQEKEESIEKTVKKGKTSPKRIVREIFAAFIGAVMSGLVGIFVIFMMILPMGTYERLDVAFSLKPPLFFPAYWVAIVFSAVLGLMVVPFLRLIKTKSFILSILLGGIIGGVIVGIAHMATGLNYDIIIMQDINPIGFRGYWIAVIFSVLIGFFAQIINRIICKIGFFRISEE